MYFKVRCIREQVRTVISLVTFFLPVSLLISLLRPFAERLLGLQLDTWPNSLCTWAGGIILGLILGIPLQFYKVYEFTDREVHVQWWYGNWGFYFNWLLGGMQMPKRRLRQDGSPLMDREDEPRTYRGCPDEFEPEIIQAQLSRGAQPDSVLGTGRTVKTLPRSELYDVKILESIFGATLLLRLRGCGEFTERFVWQYQLHNRGRLFVIRLTKARGEEAWSNLKKYTRR